MKEKLKVFEAFAGIGSQTQALKNIGVEHEVVAISEIDKYAIASYEAIHGKTKNVGDISKLKDEDIPDCDLFTYSFPCQDISLEGKKYGFEQNGKRSNLLWECERVIRVKKPKYLMLKNVKNLVGKKHKQHFDRWLEILEGYGYNNYWKVLNAKDYGIPQNRERVFVISIRKDVDDGTFEFPEPMELKLYLKDMLEDEVDEKLYLSEDRKNQYIYKQKQEVDGKLFIKNGTKKGYLEAQFGDGISLAYPNSKNRRGRVQHQIVSTLDTGCLQGVCTEKCNIRRLTPKECWRLMGFKDKQFEKAQKVVSDKQLRKQAGNSIVVDVLENIFSNLFKG